MGVMKILKIIFLFVFMNVNSQFTTNVMTYNIRYGTANDVENHWDKRKDKVIDILTNYNASIIGLQEAQKFQLDYILEKMPNYSYIGKPREDDKNAEYSCILYKKDDFEVVSKNTLWLSKTPNTMSKGWDAVCYRIVTYGLFQSKKEKDKKIWILNTHLDHLGIEARYESSNFLKELSNQLILEQNFPLLLMGDFNATLTEKSIENLLVNFDETSSKSINKSSGLVATFNNFEFETKPLHKIDYVFCFKNALIKILNHKTIDFSFENKYPSDHFPVLVNIEY
jgi:endonuclease/exonuclease/phosphatase family metal-dependent hydrolase